MDGLLDFNVMNTTFAIIIGLAFICYFLFFGKVDLL